MVLPAFIKELEDVDEKYREQYKKGDDGFTLDVDDKGFKSKLDEFRTNNRKLHKSVEDLTTKMKSFEGIDLEKYQKALEAGKKLEKLEDSDLLKEGKIDELLEKRTQTMRENFEIQVKAKDVALKTAAAESTAVKAKLSSLLIDTDMRSKVEKVGKVRAGAIEDILNRARKTFKVNEEGKVVAESALGEQVYDSKGDAMTMEAWAQDLLQNAGHLFESAGGGGGAGGKKRVSESGVKIISGDDPLEFGRNLDKIAKGEVEVSG